jgi:hypothetical protein
MSKYSQFNELFAVLNQIQDEYRIGILESLTHLMQNKEDYNAVVQYQLNQFMAEGQTFFGESA